MVTGQCQVLSELEAPDEMEKLSVNEGVGIDNDGELRREGIDWIIRKMPSVSAQSIFLFLPSGAVNFNCRQFVDS